jgi:hypothetical protein
MCKNVIVGSSYRELQSQCSLGPAGTLLSRVGELCTFNCTPFPPPLMASPRPDIDRAQPQTMALRHQEKKLAVTGDGRILEPMWLRGKRGRVSQGPKGRGRSMLLRSILI